MMSYLQRPREITETMKVHAQITFSMYKYPVRLNCLQREHFSGKTGTVKIKKVNSLITSVAMTT